MAERERRRRRRRERVQRDPQRRAALAERGLLVRTDARDQSRAAPELGFVSANNWDAIGAVSAGLRTFWIQRSAAEVPEELGFQVDTIVKALTDLAPLLRG